MKKLMALLIIVIVIVSIMLMINKNNDVSVIGNPDFESSFLHITSSNFAETIENTGNEMGFPISFVSSAEGIYIINDIYIIHYTEGFLKMTFEEESDKNSVVNMIELIVRTLESSDSDIDFIMQEVIKSETVEALFSGEYGMYSTVNRYDFDITEENGYEFHVEDARMGH